MERFGQKLKVYVNGVESFAWHLSLSSKARLRIGYANADCDLAARVVVLQEPKQIAMHAVFATGKRVVKTKQMCYKMCYASWDVLWQARQSLKRQAKNKPL